PLRPCVGDLSPPGPSDRHHGISPMKPMTIGVPKEVKTDEYRVAMLPVGVEELTKAGHRVLVQAGAGQGSGLEDDNYTAHGAALVAAATDIWSQADLIVKVKEPLAHEWPLMRAR